MTQDESRIQKIKALLANAEDPSLTQPARESYLAKANELIIKWEIDEARLMAAGDERLKTEAIISKTIVPSAPTSYGYEFATIGCRVANALGMSGLMTKAYDSSYKARDAYIITGFQSDVDRAIILIESLLRQCVVALGSWTSEQQSGYFWSTYSGSRKFNEKKGFILGFSSRVAQRLKELREARVSETKGTGTDLVLVGREEQVVAWVQEKYKIGRSRARRAGYDGQSAGRAAGSRADIGQSRFGQAARGSVGA